MLPIKIMPAKSASGLNTKDPERVSDKPMKVGSPRLRPEKGQKDAQRGGALEEEEAGNCHSPDLLLAQGVLPEFASNKYFPDSILVLFASLSVCIAFPFYPIYIIAIFAIAAFFVTRFHPLAGLMVLSSSLCPYSSTRPRFWRLCAFPHLLPGVRL